MASSSSRKQGFAALDPAEHRELARRGGQAAHALGRAHRWTSAEAYAAGKLGGKASAARREAMAKQAKKKEEETDAP